MIYIHETYAVTIPASSDGPGSERRGWIDSDGNPVDSPPLPRGYTRRALVALLTGTEQQTLAGYRWAIRRHSFDPKTGAVESRAYSPVPTANNVRRFWRAFNEANRTPS